MNPLPVEPAYRLAQRAADQNWLVTSLWSEEAVGIICGEPKCCKSFLALDLAVAVAAGTPCLRRFSVPKPGRVLLYAAEDAFHIVRRRLDGTCATVGLSLVDLDVQVITAPTLRLDLDADRGRLDETIARLQPRLLVAARRNSTRGETPISISAATATNLSLPSSIEPHRPYRLSALNWPSAKTR